LFAFTRALPSPSRLRIAGSAVGRINRTSGSGLFAALFGQEVGIVVFPADRAVASAAGRYALGQILFARLTVWPPRPRDEDIRGPHLAKLTTVKVVRQSPAGTQRSNFMQPDTRSLQPTIRPKTGGLV
jgi:hypothetical protein